MTSDVQPIINEQEKRSFWNPPYPDFSIPTSNSHPSIDNQPSPVESNGLSLEEEAEIELSKGWQNRPVNFDGFDEDPDYDPEYTPPAERKQTTTHIHAASSINHPPARAKRPTLHAVSETDTEEQSTTIKPQNAPSSEIEPQKIDKGVASKQPVLPRKPTLPDAALPDKQPLGREKIKAPEFPIKFLGTLLHNTVLAVHQMTQAPLAICASCVLAAATLAVQGFANVNIRDRIVPLTLFFLIIGSSGERKSTVDSIVQATVRDLEKKYRRAYQSQIQAYEIEIAVYENRKKRIIKIADAYDRNQALEELGDPPDHPLSPVLTMSDPTVEGLIKALQHSHPSVGIFSAEAGKLLGGYGMAKDQQLKSAATFSQAWDGTPFEMTRAGSGQLFIEGKRICANLMVQESAAIAFLTNEVFVNQGLLSRFLISFPDSAIGTRFNQEIPTEAYVNLEVFHNQMREILNTQPPLVEGTRNILEPRDLPLSSEAEALLNKFHDEIEAGMAEAGRYSGIRSFTNKVPEHAARLAGVLTLFENLEEPSITPRKMKIAIGIIRYYLNEALRINTSAITDGNLLLAEKLLKWAKSCGKHFSLVDAYQKGPTAIRKKSTALGIISILVDHNLVRKTQGGMNINGKFRHEIYEII